MKASGRRKKSSHLTHAGRRQPPLVRGALLLAAAAVVAVVVSASSSDGAEDYREMRAVVSAQQATAEPLNDVDPNESLGMSVTFQLQHRDELDALIAAQQRPGTPEYHHWLSPDEFAARFGAAPDTYAEMAEWLRRQGFTVRTWPSRSRIDFAGAVNGVEAAFRVRMNSYRHRARRALGNATPPQLPARFAATVQAVRLNTFRMAEPLVRIGGSTNPGTAMGPRDMQAVYDVISVLDRGIDGSGQTIAVVARSDFNLSDVTSFREQFGLPVHAPVKVFPAGNPGIGSPDGACGGFRDPRFQEDCIFAEESEVLLDVQWAGAMAPGATVLVDVSDTEIDASLMDIVTHHPEAKIISISFGLCERLESSMMQVMEPLYVQAAAQGQTVLVAAGNDGSDGCEDRRGAAVNGLASSAEVTAVGGTALNPGFDANGAATGYVSEAVWNDDAGASGGGVSSVVPKPAYQSGAGVPMDGFRDQPDVSLMASPTSAGYVMVIDGSVEVIGGTSAATPSWAGIVALVNQAAGREGSGAINASLYDLGRQQYDENGTRIFHDVTSGDNGIDGVQGFAAAPGFDLASGLGTPDVALLVQALAPACVGECNPETPTPTPSATPTATPTLATPACAGDCNGDGVVTVSELVTAVNIILGTIPESKCQPGDADGDGRITVNDIVQAVNRVLDGC